MDKLSIEVAEERLRELRKEIGYSNYDHLVKKLNRERLTNYDREKRKEFRWPRDYKAFYKQQQGICPECGNEMAFVWGRVEIDHIDPNADDYNAKSNLRLVHTKCNREKGARSPIEQAKRRGKTLKDYLANEKTNRAGNS